MAEFWSGLLEGLALPVEIVKYVVANTDSRALGKFFGYQAVFQVLFLSVVYAVKRFIDWNWERKHPDNWLAINLPPPHDGWLEPEDDEI